MEEYYYKRLDKRGQAVYHSMLSGLTNRLSSFSVPLLDGGELSEIYFALRMDHPELFYSIQFRYRFYPESDHAELIPEYLFDKKKIIDQQKGLKARVEKLARPAKDLKDPDKLLYIHDFICKSVHYDKLKKPYSHEIIGPLGQGVGVCEGIAKSVKILCDALGIWCVIAICDNNLEKGIKYRHTWNIVRLEGKYYHLDTTFDLSLSKGEEIRYDYFLLDDEQIFRDHEPVIYSMPACVDKGRFYYREKKLSFTKTEDVRNWAAQAVKKGRSLTFHWRGGYLTREVLSEIFTILEEEGRKKGKYAKVSLNWPQAVIRVEFEQNIPEEQMVMEEANEGEKE